MNVRVNLFCGVCGKSCGRLQRNDEGGYWYYSGKLSLPATDRELKSHTSVRIPLAMREDDPDDWAVLIGVTCTSGHHLDLDTEDAALWRAIRHGRHAATLGGRDHPERSANL